MEEWKIRNAKKKEQNPNLGTLHKPLTVQVTEQKSRPESWRTPSSSDGEGGIMEMREGCAGKYKLRDHVAAEEKKRTANPSTAGSRRGLWPTARSLDGSVNESLETWTARHHRKEAEGINLHRPLPIAVMQEQNKVAAMEKRQELWPTITAHTPDMESNGPNGHQGTYLAGAVKQWATPRSGKTTDENPETWAKRQEKGDVATMPLTAQVKAWATPKCQDSHNPGLTNCKPGSTLHLGTQAARLDHQKNVGKLNPRWVETLMGLPVGWTMPSCKSPVTIEQTNCDSSATESFQQPQNEHSELF
jgi:hypothetical protein